MPTNEETQAVQAEMGKVITLGKTYAEFALADDKKIVIRRMGMNKELRFIELYKKFVDAIKSEQDTVMSMLNEYMGGASKVQFGVMQAMELIGDVFGKLPKLQAFAIEGVQLIALSSGKEISAEWLKDNLSTVDCFEILGAQAEVQGLLSSFRGLAASLNSLSPR